MRNACFSPIVAIFACTALLLASCASAPTPAPGADDKPAPSPPATSGGEQATQPSSAPPSAAAPSDAQAGSAMEQGRALTSRFYAKELNALWPQLSTEVQTKLGGQDKFVAFREQVEQELGSETKVLDEAVANTPPYRIYMRTASFSKSQQPIIVQWALTTEGQVAGFYIKPKPSLIEGAAATAATEQGRAFTAQFYDGKTAELWARMTPEMQRTLGGADKFAAVYHEVHERLGAETKVLDEKVAKTPPYQIYLRTASFAKIPQPVLLQWVFSDDAQISGFVIQPAR